MATDYYKVLGLQKGADEKAIRDAYRKLARKYHPDVNPNDPKAEAKFKEVSEAYEVLKDPDKRAKYDQFGTHWEAAQHAGQNYQDFQTNFGGGGGFEGIFEQIFSNFGGGDPFGQARFNQVPPRDVERTVDVTLEEIDAGTTRILTYGVEDACKQCKGQRSVQAKGGGRTGCPACHGTGTAQTTHKVEVKIPAGIPDGKKLRVPGRGATGSNGRAGDLYVVVRETKHRIFKRVGEDTEVETDVPYTTAALGGDIAVPTIRGQVTMKVPSGSQSGQLFRLGGQGVSKLGGGKGSLRVRIRITVPKELGKEERALLEKIKEVQKVKA